MAHIKPLVVVGQRGEALFKSRESTWWHVREAGDSWKQSPVGSYAPFDAILADDPRNVFPDIDVPNGTVVKVTVEVIQVGGEDE